MLAEVSRREGASAFKELVIQRGSREGPPRLSGVRLQLGAHDGLFPDQDEPREAPDYQGVVVALEGYLSDAPPGLNDRRLSDARIVHDLYLQHGEGALGRIDGQYCVVIVDARMGKVIVGNDKIGKSQGYVHVTPQCALFATTLREMNARTRESFNVDHSSLLDMLMLGCIPAPHSMLQDVAKLGPATLAVISDNGVSTSRYYDIVHHRAHAHTDEQFPEAIIEHLLDAVARGARVAPKWGSFLSGGLDSSFVVWALQQYAKCDTFYATFGRLDSYMAIPDEQSVAAEVAAAFHTEHKVLSIGSEAIQRVKGIVEAIEEPFCDGGPIVIDAVLAAAAARGDAMMTGNGGDFLFGGERRHLLVSLMGNRKMAPVWMLAQIASALAPAKLPSERLARLRFDLQRCLALRNLTVADFYSQRFSGEQEILGLFHKDIDPRGFRSPAACIESELGHVGDLDDLTKVLYLDLKVLTPNLLIRDVRSVARGYGVNTYHPYLDSKFVEFGMGIPSRLKVRGLTLKHIMRKAMEPHLPESVLTKKKGGLGAPILYWVTDRKGLVADVLSEETIRRRGLFSYGAIEKMRNATVSRSKDYSMLLWTIFTTELWMQQFVDQQADSAAPALRRA